MSSHEMAVVAGQHYIVDDDTGCWEWTGYKLRGYAWAGRPAHRVIYEQLVGPIPDGNDLHHGCHNRACVNPAHMRPLPTSLHRSAHKQALSPLTEADVIAIRHAAAAGTLLNDLAVKYAVHPNTIGAIVVGRNWATAAGPVGEPLRRCGFCGDEYRGHRLSRYCSSRCKRRFNRQKARP